MASRFWIGGTGTWDASDTTHWSGSSGGSGGSSVPGSSDTVTFDGSSGGGTVTVNTAVNVVSITMGAFTGTLDFAAHDNNVTLQTFSGTGSGTRTLNMGDGTWTITGAGAVGTLSVWDMTTVTNLTFAANGSTIALSVNQSGIVNFIPGASMTYNNITMTGGVLGPQFSIATSTTFANWTVTGPAKINVGSGATITVSNAYTWTGSPAGEIVLWGSSWSSSKISVASGTSTMKWASIGSMQFIGGGTFSATKSFDVGGNSGITISNPSTGTAGIIGG